MMTREQIEADIALLNGLHRHASDSHRPAILRAITRLRADLDAMPVGETRTVYVNLYVKRGLSYVYETLDDANECATDDRDAIVVADIPVRQVPVIGGKVSK